MAGAPKTTDQTLQRPVKQRDSIALLIDADNAPAAKIDLIVTELARHGELNIRRAYGNWKKAELASWEQMLHDHAIQPMQFFDLVKGKNATDMGLIIDAMDILYTKDVDIFCLVSSDCDFTPLVQRLRAEGKKVIGFGQQKTPKPFVDICTRFLYLDDRVKSMPIPKKKKPVAAVAAKTRATGEALKRNTKLMNTLRSAVRAARDVDGWANFGAVGTHISNLGPFDLRTFGYAKLSGLFAAIDFFVVAQVKNGSRSERKVRLKVNQPMLVAV